jgi:hypothetical protein
VLDFDWMGSAFHDFSGGDLGREGNHVWCFNARIAVLGLGAGENW